MFAVIRVVVVYLALLAIFRLTGKRTLAQITAFDFLLLLIIGDIVQPALMDSDNSLTAGLVVIITLVTLDIGMSLVKQKSKVIDRLADGVPLILVENGETIKEHMEKARVDESDVLHAARELRSIERLDQIKYAILERSGGITVIATQGEGGPGGKSRSGAQGQ